MLLLNYNGRWRQDMGQLSAVMDELEALGAVGGSAAVEAVEAEPEPETNVVRMVPPLPPASLPNERYAEFSERLRLVHEVCEESLQKLAIVAKQVQDLQRVFTQLLDVTRLEEGERDAQIHQEA